ncbi:MAG: phosphoribosyltransferase [Deinococcales bacterium]
MAQFQDRRDAGRRLAGRLQVYAGRKDVLVLGLPRGGLPVAAEVADALGCPLDVLVVRKLGVPGHEELAMGALASGGGRVLNDDIVRELGLSADIIERVTRRERAELERRERAFRGDLPAPEMRGRTVILIDDGIATGATMRSAVAAARTLGPARVVVATPVAASESLARLRDEADEVVCLATPQPFTAVGRWYLHFPQTDDAEVRSLLARRAGVAREQP